CPAHLARAWATDTFGTTPSPPILVGHRPTTAVTAGTAGRLTDIVGAITISNLPNYTAVTVDDSADPSEATVTLEAFTAGGADFGRVSLLGGAPIDYKAADTGPVTVHTGLGGATVNVLATRVNTNLVGHGANTTVNVGDAGRLTNILGEITVTNPLSFTAVNVDDSADPDPRTVTLDTVSVNGADHGRISFVGGVPILYKYADTANVRVGTGQNNDVVSVLGTGASQPVSLHTRPGNDTVRVGDAAGALTVYGEAGDDILVSNGGNHTLDGGAGRDLLIAGAGPATLLGGADEDILVGGTTAYDLDPAALAAVAAEWARQGVPYAERVYH